MLTTLTSFRDPWEAHLLRARLLAEHIPATVAHDQHIWMNWPLSVALGGAKVQVPGEELEHAREVLERCASGQYKAELAEIFGDLEDTVCPNCGSDDFRRRPSLPEIVFGIGCLAFGIAVKLDASKCKCRNCGARWREDSTA
jgi:predicted RNA-binding Zn-ribbon protein involved in translation (DUF1610 family)